MTDEWLSNIDSGNVTGLMLGETNQVDNVVLESLTATLFPTDLHIFFVRKHIQRLKFRWFVNNS